MAYEIPTLSEIDTRLQANMKSRIEEASSILRRSLTKIFTRVFAGAVRLIYGYQQYQEKQIFISTADSENLERHANEYGISPTSAAKATGAGTATGTVGATISANSELQRDDGYIYLTDELYIIPASGSVAIAFTAELTGSIYNDDSITLSFVSPPAGVNSDITVGVLGIDGGTDDEESESLRNRTLTRKRQPPAAGTEFDYEAWMLEVSGNTRSWAFPELFGLGTVGLAFVRDNDTPIIPTPTELETTYDYIIEHVDPVTGLTVGAPVTAQSGIFMITLSMQTIDMTIKLDPNTIAVQNQIRTQLTNLLLAEGGPGETLLHSNISAAISGAPGENAHKLTTPSDDITIAYNRVPAIGTITFEEYT